MDPTKLRGTTVGPQSEAGSLERHVSRSKRAVGHEGPLTNQDVQGTQVKLRLNFHAGFTAPQTFVDLSAFLPEI